MALFILIRFINFNTFVVVSSEKEKHFACSECFQVFNIFGRYLYSSRIATFRLATCARKPKVPGSSPAAGYVQR